MHRALLVIEMISDWHAAFAGLIRRLVDGPGKTITEQLSPDADDYFILKPRHSAFYLTPLEIEVDAASRLRIG